MSPSLDERIAREVREKTIEECAAQADAWAEAFDCAELRDTSPVRACRNVANDIRALARGEDP